jgi:hypothetical protein
MIDKLWVVVQRIGGEVSGAEVFERESDARNFYEERIHGSDFSPCDEIYLLPSVLHRREETLVDETPWGVEVPDVNAEFVEGLLEEMDEEMPLPHPDLTARFLREKRDKLQSEAAERVRGYVLDELRDYIEHGLEGCACTED